MTSRLSTYRYFRAKDGLRVGYRTSEAKDGKPLLLLHGMASRGTTWDAIADQLVANGHRLVVPDMRGHGSSGRASGYPLEVFAEDMLALLDELALDEVDVIGHSLGGHTALTMAQRAPARFGALVIEDTPIPPLDSADAANVARKLTPRRVVASAGVVKTIALALWRRFDLKMARPTIAALREPMPEWWAGVARIDARVLLLGATQSHVPAERIDLLAARLPKADVRILEGGHRLHTEQRDAFLAAVLPFLRVQGSQLSAGETGRQRFARQ